MCTYTLQVVPTIGALGLGFRVYRDQVYTTVFLFGHMTLYAFLYRASSRVPLRFLWDSLRVPEVTLLWYAG